MKQSANRPHIQIIVGSVREGRMSRPVADWVIGCLSERDDLTCELVDLADWNFPQFALKKPPAMGAYENRLQIAWAQTIARGDAYIFVGPEYNHGYSGVLKTALDYLMAEWKDKPATCVTFGNVGGARMVENLQPVLIELGMIPSAPSSHLMGAHRKRDGHYYGSDEKDRSALNRSVDQLLHWLSLTHEDEKLSNVGSSPRILVLGLGQEAIDSVVQTLRLDGFDAQGLTVPEAEENLPAADEFDIICFGRGALGDRAEALKKEITSTNPQVKLVETYLPIAVRQIEACVKEWRGEERSLGPVGVDLTKDLIRVSIELARPARISITVYSIEGRLASRPIISIDAHAGSLNLQIPAPDMAVSGVIIDADGSEFAHIPNVSV